MFGAGHSASLRVAGDVVSVASADCFNTKRRIIVETKHVNKNLPSPIICAERWNCTAEMLAILHMSH